MQLKFGFLITFTTFQVQQYIMLEKLSTFKDGFCGVQTGKLDIRVLFTLHCTIYVYYIDVQFVYINCTIHDVI